LLVNESDVYFQLNNAEQARRAYSDAKNVIGKNTGTRMQAILLKSLSSVLFLEKQFSQAVSVAERCLNLSDIANFPLQRGTCYTAKARGEMSLGNYAVAVKDLNTAIQYNEKISSDTHITTNHKLLSEAYEAMNNNVEALKYFKSYYQANKKVLFDRRQGELYSLEESFNAENNRNSLALLNSQHELKNLELARQTMGSRVVFGMTLCAALALVYVIKKNQTIAKKNELLECSNTDLVELSTRDALTGLYNRRYLEQYLQALKQDSRFHQGTNFSLAIMDLDHFKMINDNYGHDIGDLVLIEVAKRFVKQLPLSDLIVRWGGEEFICLIEDQDDIFTLQRLEKVLTAIAAWPVNTPVGDIYITLSIGAVTDIPVTELMFSHTELIKRADERLYKAKENGRNQIIAID